MPLAPCRECGRSVSSEAASCPNCGVPHPHGYAQQGHGPGSSSRPVSAGTVATGVFGGILGCFIAPFVVGLGLLLMLGMCMAAVP